MAFGLPFVLPKIPIRSLDVGAAFYAKYSAMEILGRGVSSTVRRCVEKDTGKSYAAKIVDVSQDLNCNEDFRGLLEGFVKDIL